MLISFWGKITAQENLYKSDQGIMEGMVRSTIVL